MSRVIRLIFRGLGHFRQGKELLRRPLRSFILAAYLHHHQENGWIEQIFTEGAL